MNIVNNLPVLIIVVPMSAALLCVFISRFCAVLGRLLVIAAIAAAHLMSIALLCQVQLTENKNIHYAVGNWDAPIGIEFVIDPISGLLAVFITLVALCAAIYSWSFINKSEWISSGGFYALMGLLTIGLTGMTLTGDVFNLYVFLEISSLSCYGLVAMGGKRSVLAAFRYLLIGTIGASFYLVAIGILYSMTGSLNMADIASRLQGQMDNPLIMLACASLVASFGIKMAIFPFHAWQPDAYSFAHPGASALISGAMSKVPSLAMIRFFIFIFGGKAHQYTADTLFLIMLIGAAGMIVGSVVALGQKDFRRMLAYSSVAQLGYVAMGIGLANVYGLTGAYLHILNHIMMKGALFFAIGAIQYRFGTVRIYQFGQIYKKMPLTCFTIVVAALSMIGIPPTGGFFSKWYLLLGAVDAKMYFLIAVLIVSSLLNAIYFLRALEKIFIAQDYPRVERKKFVEKTKLELPLNMLIPMLVFAVGIIVMGFMNSHLVTTIIKTTFEGVL